MKRIGYLYEKLCDKSLISYAIFKASQGKTKRKYVRRILNNKDYYIDQIYNMFVNQDIQLSPHRERVIFDTSSLKERDIKIPHFYPDQIIHWCVVIVTQPIMEKGMYQYCIGSVPNKGGIVGKKYLERQLKNNHKLKYCLKMDIHKFFPSVCNECMLNQFKKKIKDKKILNLIERILTNGGFGLPIGYYTSQWYSNFYLEPLDHLIKDDKQIPVYVRYVDDMVLLDTNKRRLHKMIVIIKSFLATIKLELKKNYQVWRIDSRPIDFLGYRFFTKYTQLRKRIYYRICRRLAKIGDFVTISQARGLLSLIGWVYQLKNKFYYSLIPLKKRLARYVSEYDRRETVYGNI